jgi:hypothetical protein
MTSKRFAAIMIPALVLALGASGSALADPVVLNGSFESASGYGQLSSGTYSGVNVTNWGSLNPNNGTTPGYNFLFDQANAGTGVPSANGPVALYSGVTASPDGGNFLAADPNFDTSAVFQQNIGDLVASNFYTIGFYYALTEQAGFGGTAYTGGFAVTFGGQTDNTTNLSINSAGNPSDFSGWSYAELVFTAASTTQMLSFLATETTNGGPPFMLLDGVTITPGAIPEPSTVVLTAIGAVGFIGVGLRRRAKAAKV